jgi:hypothetical protein
VTVVNSACVGGTCYVAASPATLRVTAVDVGSGPATATVIETGATTTLLGGSADLVVPVGPSAITANLRVTDAVGNASTVSVTIALDAAPPSCTLTSPVDGAVTRHHTVAAEVTSVDAGSHGVTVTVTADNVGFPLAPTPAGKFAGAGALPPTDGPVTVQAECRDAVGNTSTSAPVTLTVDRTPPVIDVLWPENGAKFGITSRVQVQSPNGDVTQVIVAWSGGSEVLQLSGDLWESNSALPSTVTGIEILAADAAGNVIRVLRAITYDASSPSIASIMLGGNSVPP